MEQRVKERTVKHVKKNDVVQVMVGRDKGKTGKILRINNKTGKVVVEKVNMIKRHKKATGTTPGGILEMEAPIHASNVLLYSDKLGKGLRTQVKVVDGGKKVRFNAKNNLQLDK
jgi:large subunit ribosomal protein L24